jgi:hypothetical protein
MAAPTVAFHHLKAARVARLSLAVAIVSIVVLGGTAASALGYLPAPPSLSASPGSPPTPFAGPATLHLGFIPETTNCTVTALSQPYRFPRDGQGEMVLSGNPAGRCRLGDWAEVFSASSFGNPVAGVYRVQVSMADSWSSGSPVNSSLLSAYFYLPITSSLLTLTIRIDLGAVFPAEGVSVSVAFAGPFPT